MTACDTTSHPSPQKPARGPAGAWLVLLAALSGFFVFLSFPPADLGPLAWVALVPFLAALAAARTARQALALTLVFAFVFMAGFFAYLRMYGLLPWLALALVESVVYLLAGVGIFLVWRRCNCPVGRTFAAAAIWSLIEFFRGNLGSISLTLGSLGHTQHSLLPILQIASLFGVGGIGFLIVLANAALAEFALGLFSGRPESGYRALRMAAVILAAVTIWGGVVLRLPRPAPESAPTKLNVVAVQGNVELHTPVTREDSANSARIYADMTRAAPGKPDLVIWPETALPVVLDSPGDAEYTGDTAALAREMNANLLVGASETAGQGMIYNTAFLFNPDGAIADHYRKDHLVLFGEYVPYRKQLKFIEKYPVRMSDYAPGGPRNVMHAGAMPFGTVICFEGLFPEAVREVCRRGAQMIVIITSDAWAEGSYEVAQHSATGVFPAVEARKWLVRAATTGRSAIVSPYGEVVSTVPEFQAGYASALVPASEGLSLCHRGGWLAFLIICVGIVVVAARKGPTSA